MHRRLHRRLVRIVHLMLVALVLSTALVALPAALSAESGPTRRALVLNGTDSYLEVTSGPNPSSAITIEAWVYRFYSDRCETVVGKDFQTSYWLGFCPQRIRFYAHGSGSAVDGNAAIPAAVWTHIAVTYDGTTRRYYVNGDLDLESTVASGPLTPNSAPVGIGFDPSRTFASNYFSGMLDEVRIWSIARTPEQIRADMQREIWMQGGLLGAWRMNGSGNDIALTYFNQLQGGTRFDTNGALPRNLTLPRTSGTVTVDGACGATEYGAAERVGLRRYASLNTAYLQHSGDDLYVCIEGLDQGVGRSVAIAFDRDNSRDSLAQPGDYRFVIGSDGAANSEQGDGSGGFQSLSAPPGSWSAAAQNAGEFTRDAEFRVSRDLLGLPADWSGTLGMDLVERGDPAGANHWPVSAVENSPLTWSSLRFNNAAGAVPTYSLSGRVLDTRGNAVAHVAVQLIGSNSAGSSLIATARTNSEGRYNFSYTGYGPDLFIVEEIDPRGATSVTAAAGSDGSVRSANILFYPGSPTSKIYSSGSFVDALERAALPSFDRHYLIVYSNPLRELDLWPIVDMKQLEGYQVEAKSTQEISVSVSGRDLAEKVRNWLKSRWQAHYPAAVYALLVGRGDRIPVRDVGWEGDRTHRRPGTPGYAPAVLTDWYYADLDSNWDRDGDGFYGEFLYCAPGEREVPNPSGGDPLACPPAGDPQREGPYGTRPGPEDDWKAEIAIGRLLANTPAEVRRALQTSVASESSGALDKRNALIGGAFWGYDGRSWNAEQGRYVNGGEAGSDGALYYPWDGEKPYGLDTAEHLDVTLRPILDRYMDNVTALYESTAPGGDAALSPTRRPSDAAVNLPNMQTQWSSQRFGLVNLAGHGNGDGVWAQHWVNDWNGNRAIDNPARPEACPGGACWEIGGWQTFIDASMPNPLGVAPIVFANACSTGDQWIAPPEGSSDWRQGRETVSSQLPTNGKVAAWIGGVSIVPVTGLDSFQDEFNQSILGPPLLLGDALWRGMQTLIGDGADWRRATPQLFGDPAYSYWGNPADMRAFWPQAGRDWFASSATSANGPAAGLRLWTATNGAPNSPPVVDRSGKIIVAGGSQLVVFGPNADVRDSRTLATTSAYQPAITTDGVYVAADSTLYAYDRNLELRDSRALTLGNRVTGAPRVGPDGVVWLPTRFGIMRYTPASLTLIPSFGSPAGHVAFTRSGGTVWTNDNGAVRFYKIDRYGNLTQRELAPALGAATSPVVGPTDDVYIGRGNALVSIAAGTGVQRWLYNTGSAVTAPPAVGLDGTIYAVNQAGSLVAVAPNGTLRWSRSIGVPIVATPAADASRLYVAAGSRLYALDLASGEQLWNIDLGASVDARSTPVIGANRTAYVTTSGGRLVAIGEGGWLTAPSDLAVEAGIGSATISWRDNSSGETGFQIDSCLLGGPCAPLDTVPADTTSFTVTNLAVGQPFTLRVQAIGANGGTALATAVQSDTDESSDFVYSEVVVPLAAAPAAPASLSAAPKSAESIQVSWSYGASIAELSGFDIYRSASGSGIYQQIGSVGPAATSFLDKGLAPGTTYFYKVRARTGGGASALAGPASAATKTIGLARPTRFDIAVRSGAMALTWQDNATGESGYVVERRAPGLATHEVLALLPAGATSYVDAYNLAGGIYEYRVKAITAATESAYATTTANYVQLTQWSVFLPLIRR